MVDTMVKGEDGQRGERVGGNFVSGPLGRLVRR